MTVALVTGATQGLGLALVHGLAARLTPADTVYLTGRDPARVAALAEAAGPPVRGEVLDVADPSAAAALAGTLRERHGTVDVVLGNAVMRVGPSDDPRAFITGYCEVNNFGTTRLLRAFAPLLPGGGRLIVVASSLGTLHHLAPVLHPHFDALPTLDAVDAAVTTWRDAILDGSARAGAWPSFANIPSKIAQVAAVRALAAQRPDILVCAACPGMINTPTSGLWWDVSGAPSPAEAAVALVSLALDPIRPAHHGELVRHGRPVPWN